MLLHVFVGDGQLVKPPENLGTLRLVISTSGGYGKGGREFDCGTNWTEGSLVRFHNTVVVGAADDPTCGKLTLELRGTYKDNVAKEVTLGVAAIETNPKQKSRTYVLNLEPSKGVKGLFFAGDSTASSIAKLSVTLFQNRFAVDLSPDEVALRHKQELLASKEAKTKAKPSAREYSFLLNRKMNWNKDDSASFNHDTEKKLNRDVVTNLKDLYSSKQDAKKAALENAERGRQRLRSPYEASEPRLAYGAGGSRPATFIDISPHRPTALDIGFVGVSGVPSSPPREGKGDILYKKSEQPEDPMDEIYTKMVLAEKRRLMKTAAKAKKAHFQSSLDRAKSQIIAQKARENEQKEEMMRRMMEKSDSQLRELRDEINRRKRRIAYLGLQKHISEEDARRKAKNEQADRAKTQARREMEVERQYALKMARSTSPARRGRSVSVEGGAGASPPQRSQSAQPSSRTGPPMPYGKNAIPLRKGPEPEILRQSRESALASEKAAVRKRLEEEAQLALLEAHSGPTGFHAVNNFATNAATRPSMPVERNRLPLRKAEAVTKRARELQESKRREAENRAKALAAAQATHERMRMRIRAQGRSSMPIEGVIQHNPFPVRNVPAGGTLGGSAEKTKGKYYDFSQIGSAAKEALLSEGEDPGMIGRPSSNSRRSSPGGSTPNTYSFTMADGTTLTHKSMSELEKMIAAHRRRAEMKRTKKVVKKKVGTQKKMSGAITSAHPDFDRKGRKYATPVDETKKFKKFYSPDYKAPDTSSQEETDALVKEFESTVGKYQKNSDKKDWLASAQQSMDTLESRTGGIAMTAAAVDSYGNLMNKGDSLVSGDGGKSTTSKTPGFLSAYTGKGTGKGTKTAGAATKEAKNIATKLEKASEQGKKDAANDDSVDLIALKAQLEAQGVTVDQKMLDIMASLGTDKKGASSPAVKKSNAMAQMESALHHDEKED